MELTRAPLMAPEHILLSPYIGPGSKYGDPFLGPKKVLKRPPWAALAYSLGLPWRGPRQTPTFFPGKFFENQTAIFYKNRCNGQHSKLHYLSNQPSEVL